MSDPSTPEGLRQSREALRLTQDELATQLGVTRRSIIYMERGERPIERRTVLAVLYLLEHPPQ